MPRPDDTIAALATPAGTAALAVIRLSGPACAGLATELFGAAPLPRSVRRADYRDRAGRVLDDVLGTFFAGPRSYTGEDLLEISCHGNPFIAQAILGDLLARGCRAAGPGEFTQRAFLNGRLDLSQAEAVMDLIHARSERALAAAHRQLRGALGRRMSALADRLLGVLARVEAQIDFPEEDLPPDDGAALRAAVGEILGETRRLLATGRYGELLRDGVRTVILGAPNAGKSSLLNRLVGRPRALVSPAPGTTRDFLEERVMAGPHCLRLTDTAGLNPFPDTIERLGIAQTHACAAEADLLLLVLDATQPAPALPPELAGRLSAAATIAVLNKCDLLAGAPAAVPPAGCPAVLVSATTGEGIDALVARIAAAADGFRRDAGEDEVAINARHARALELACERLGEVQAKLELPSPAELVASDLRDVLAAFGEILGRIDNERMLDQLFATFCIGK